MSGLLHPVTIGNVRLDSNLFLAPLAGYTDRVYRSICLSRGASLAYTEMVSAEGVARGSEKTVMLMERGQNEKNLAVQLFLPDAETAKRSLEGVMAYKPSIIDINCGCPVQKVVKTGAGSALLQNPKIIGNIVKTIVENVSVPVTVKIRTGWDVNSINYAETAEIAFDSGASAVCMHARTRSQLYMPFAHWELLSDLKKRFPDNVIIGSGDIFAAEDAVRMLRETGVDAVAFARGAIGNPFIFKQTEALLRGNETGFISAEEKKDVIMKHLNGLTDFLGENMACREMRKHVCAYLKGIPNSAKVRRAVTNALTVRSYEEALSMLC